MEEQDISMPNLRSRSRSKTPLPIMRDADQAGTEKSANSRNTPLHMDTEVIHEEPAEEIFTSPPAHRTRNALKSKTPQTSSALHSQDTTQKQHTYLSSEEVQNIKNYSYEYEHIATSQTISLNGSRSLLDSGRDGSRVHSSLSGSDYSTESFAESVLADSSRLSVEEGIQHLPYKVYKCAVEYWNKYPKTDYTYSRLSKDRVELAPGQVAVPNMSRPALHSVRHSISTQDICTASGTSSLLSESELRQRWITNTRNSRRIDTMSDSEVDEIDNWRQTYSGLKKDNRWRITKLIIAIWTYIVTTTTTIKSKIFGSDHSDRYRHANNYYTYTSMTTNKSIFSSTTEAMKQKRFWLPLLLLFLLLPALFYWWSYVVPLGNKTEELKILTVVGNNKFELTDDILNQIVLRVKQSMPPPPPSEPVIHEKIIETKTVIDPQLLAEQQDLINQLSADILVLKNKDYSMDEGMLSNIISKHVTNTVIQILGLQSTNKDEVKNDLFNQHKDYIEDQVADVREAMMMDLNKLDHKIRQDIEEMKSQNVMGGGCVHADTGCQCDDNMMRKIVKDALLIYDADKTGLVDFAMESAGGQVISTRCTQSYQTNTAVISLFGIPLWHPSNSPRTVLTPGSSPGDCWAFQGFPGYLVLKLFHRIRVTGFTLEHVSSLLSPHGQIESAPKKFTVWGLQDELDKDPILFGTYEYRNDTTPVQYFRVENDLPKTDSDFPGHDIVELRIENNHGNPVYTCLYRFRVHGDPIDSLYFQQNAHK